MGDIASNARIADDQGPLAATKSSAIFADMTADSISVRADADCNEPNLGELLLAVVNNDRHAFEAFYDATVDRALSLVLRITQQIETAEEVVSDVYLQVWRQADRFDSTRGNALAWLTVLCRSRALDAIRKNNTTPTHCAVPISEVRETESQEIPQDLLAAVEQNSAVHAALKQIEPDQRQLLALAYFRGYTHSELADITGLPLGTVKTQLRRTLHKLKEFMLAAEDDNRAVL